MTASRAFAVLPVPRALSLSDTRTPDSPARRAALTLYSIEEELAALEDTLALVPADQEDELVARIRETVVHAIDKRDQMGNWLAHLEAQVGFADTEIKRLQERKNAFQRILERAETYLVRVIQSLGQDAAGKWPKLEGRTVTFSLRKQPPSVAVDNEAVVPGAYRKTTVKLAAPLWEELLDSVDVDLAGRVLDGAKRSDEVSKSAVKQAIEGGTEVPGAHLVNDGVKLKRG